MQRVETNIYSLFPRETPIRDRLFSATSKNDFILIARSIDRSLTTNSSDSEFKDCLFRWLDNDPNNIDYTAVRNRIRAHFISSQVDEMFAGLTALIGNRTESGPAILNQLMVLYRLTNDETMFSPLLEPENTQALLIGMNREPELQIAMMKNYPEEVSNLLDYKKIFNPAIRVEMLSYRKDATPQEIENAFDQAYQMKNSLLRSFFQAKIFSEAAQEVYTKSFTTLEFLKYIFQSQIPKVENGTMAKKELVDFLKRVPLRYFVVTYDEKIQLENGEEKSVLDLFPYLPNQVKKVLTIKLKEKALLVDPNPLYLDFIPEHKRLEIAKKLAPNFLDRLKRDYHKMIWLDHQSFVKQKAIPVLAAILFESTDFATEDLLELGAMFPYTQEITEYIRNLLQTERPPSALMSDEGVDALTYEALTDPVYLPLSKKWVNFSSIQDSDKDPFSQVSFDTCIWYRDTLD